MAVVSLCLSRFIYHIKLYYLVLLAWELVFIPVSLSHNRKLCIDTFYTPPSASAAIFDTLFVVLCSLNNSLFSNLILLGDFNVDILSQSPLCRHLNSLQYSFSLTQVVEEPTRPGHAGSTSLIDLIFMIDPQSLLECTTIPPLSNSDHLGICLHIKSQCRPKPSRSSGGPSGDTNMQTSLQHVSY